MKQQPIELVGLEVTARAEAIFESPLRVELSKIKVGSNS